jgi:hypothetical protein
MRSWLAVVLVACGGAPIHESVEQNPDWVIAYRDHANRGCACKDAACLDAARAELAQIEADHGGIDEAPPDVQTAHGDFDRCWRAGTRDPARDAAASADEICGCTTSKCVNEWKLDAMHMFDKYNVASGDGLAQLSPAAGSAWQRAAACKASVTISGGDAVTAMKSVADLACACKDLDCVQRTLQRSTGSGSGDYLVIETDDADDAQIRVEQRRMCDCLVNAFGQQLAQALPNASLSMSASCH